MLELDPVEIEDLHASRAGQHLRRVSYTRARRLATVVCRNGNEKFLAGDGEEARSGEAETCERENW
jgi:hypothetical protein